MSFFGINFSIHREGLRFIAAFLIATLVFVFISSFIAWVLFFLGIFCAFFFRNPKRTVPLSKNLVLSPADGTVCYAALDTPPEELGLGEEKRYRVSIFLSLFNVHINRIPISGKIKNIIYHPGAFLNAALDKSSIFNERNTLVLEIDGDPERIIAFTQIAGMIARRIVCDVHEGQEVNRGEIFGLIRFGSRCDIWLPVGVSPKVLKGQTMLAGESVIADLADKNTELLEGVTI